MTVNQITKVLNKKLNYEPNDDSLMEIENRTLFSDRSLAGCWLAGSRNIESKATTK